ncbi:hypothetical protein [Rhodococcus pseudokoreensis]|uniref:hypothetical protein n=1 Tax=Rhodococcus pseudokoreensis TaxID=2811421 RepID=UPI001980F379|nr:hypothetical protein [Rhodococcus pseudokoreensis]
MDPSANEAASVAGVDYAGDASNGHFGPMAGVELQIPQRQEIGVADFEVHVLSITKLVLPLFLAVVVLLYLGHQEQVLYLLVLLFASTVRWHEVRGWDPVRRCRGIRRTSLGKNKDSEIG